MLEMESAGRDIVFLYAKRRRMFQFVAVEEYGVGRVYQPRKRTFSPCWSDGRSLSKTRREGRGPLLIACFFECAREASLALSHMVD